jgi:hypothetical protein
LLLYCKIGFLGASRGLTRKSGYSYLFGIGVSFKSISSEPGSAFR